MSNPDIDDAPPPFADGDLPTELDVDVEEALRRQDSALELFARLRSEEPFQRPKPILGGGGRRDFRRWPTPHSMQAWWHNGTEWCPLECLDVAIGGARVVEPEGDAFLGPVPVRLTTGEENGTVIVLADLTWRAETDRHAGIRFEFQSEEERDHWAGCLIDALLSAQALP